MAKNNGSNRFIFLDQVSDREINRKRPTLSRRFKTFVFISFVVDLLLVSACVVGAVLWWKDGHVWVFFLRLPTVARMILLLIVLCSKVNVENLIGVPRLMKLPAHFAAESRPLGLWIITGLIDFFMIRIFLFALDLIYFSITLKLASSQGIFTVVLDAAFIAEFWLTLWFVYYIGVRRTVSKVIVGAAKEKVSSQSRALGMRRDLIHNV